MQELEHNFWFSDTVSAYLALESILPREAISNNSEQEYEKHCDRSLWDRCCGCSNKSTNSFC